MHRAQHTGENAREEEDGRQSNDSKKSDKHPLCTAQANFMPQKIHIEHLSTHLIVLGICGLSAFLGGRGGHSG